MLARWYWMAPLYLPSPIVIILKSPDSIEPLKSVWGFTRLTSPIQLASEAYLSSHTGRPSASPTCTTSMVARTGQPIVASRDAVVLEDRQLPFRRAATVAPHGREDERPGAQVFQGAHGGAHDDVDVGDATAAGTDRDG